MIHLNRRTFLSLGAVSAGELLSLGEAQGKSRFSYLNIDYQTILGNNPEEDRLIKVRIEADSDRAISPQQRKQRTGILTETSIELVKPAVLGIKIDNAKIKRRYYFEPRTERSSFKNGSGSELEWDLPRYVVRNDETVYKIATSIADGYPTLEEKAQALLCFVQTAIEFDHPKAKIIQQNSAKDYVRGPRETILDRVGDCKDTSVLYATLLAALGIPAAFLYYYKHVNVGVELDFAHNPVRIAPSGLKLDAVVQKRYYVAETTTELPTFIGKKITGRTEANLEKIRSIHKFDVFLDEEF